MQIPEPLIQQLQDNFGIDKSAFQQSHHQALPVSVRLNPLKPACSFSFKEVVPWASNAYYLPNRPVFTGDPLFHAGCYYVQEASSMFVEQAFRQSIDVNQKLVVLDACAAPGGKSTLLASLLNEESLLVSNDVISTRVPVLVHNMAKWGNSNTIVTNNDPADFKRIPGFFDVILVDAPCSGSGLFRKQVDAIEHWSEENIQHCSLRQQRILQDILPSLKQDGILIYSTCSYSVEENERMCDYLCEHFGMESASLKNQVEWGITETRSPKYNAYGYRFFPHLLQGEGFFIAIFKKKNETRNDAKQSVKAFTKISPVEEKAVKRWVKTENMRFTHHYNEICAFSARREQELKSLNVALKIKKMPLHIGNLKGKDFIPHSYLAYTKLLTDIVQKTDTDTDTALQYLRKQNISIPDENRGFTLLTYKNFGLGWFKNLGNRINNYYPADWRILKESF